MAVANRVRELAAQGRDVVGLQTGDPDFVTPAHIIEAGHAALLAGDTHYPPARGTKALLEAVAAKLERENGVRVAPTQIIATPGGKWAIYLALAALLEPGDEVILPEPAWVSYRPMIASFGGVTAGVETHSSEGYVVTADALRGRPDPAHARRCSSTAPATRTATSSRRAEFETIVEFVVANDLWLISDEIYERITFDGREHFRSPRTRGSRTGRSSSTASRRRTR